MMPRAFSVLAVAAAFGCAALAVKIPRPILVWNATASAPIGLYHRHFGRIERGNWVLIRPPSDAANLAAARNYLPKNIALIKRVAAQSGDRVCRFGKVISINGRNVAMAMLQDSQGRNLPVWSGCVVLGTQEIFLLNAPPASFDSRYFGPVPLDNVLERVAPLWTS